MTWQNRNESHQRMTTALRPHVSCSDTIVIVPKAAIELSAIKLKDHSNASLKIPKGRKPKDEPYNEHFGSWWFFRHLVSEKPAAGQTDVTVP
jgi:hypothetical protein